VSRLNDLLRQLETSNPALAKDLRREVDALSNRRAFGLNFERHVPEAVELPGRPVRRGDKVRILPPRGSNANASDDRVWRVVVITKDACGTRTASLELLDDTDEVSQAVVDDLVVAAEFRDPIYPGLVSTGKVERGGDKPYHAVINAENYHALQTLLFTHRGKVDVIYIDPPYNTGAKDWKYNNDYVEGEDLYRHSKWLAFMERRLKLARELLNPADSVLIIAIDEREYLRLGLLLEQIFPDARVQMVTDVTNPRAGVARPGAFTRTEEYLFYLVFGEGSGVVPASLSSAEVATATKAPIWFSLMRTGSNSSRSARPNLFYPIWVHEDGRLHSVGDTIPLQQDRTAIPSPESGLIALWPIRPNGDENTWQLGAVAVRKAFGEGSARINSSVSGHKVNYLRTAEKKRIAAGEIEQLGRDERGALILRHREGAIRTTAPRTVWVSPAHDAGLYGSSLLAALIPGRKFPFPKALYAAEDAIRFAVANKPEATIVDFFAGSGTTTHAIMRLNKQDDGRRLSISVTNNEVSAEEQNLLRGRGFRPGDPEWEKWGICEYITKPRITAAITGKTPAGDPIKGDYKFTDEFPIEDGFDENVEYFTLTYEAPLRVSSNREFGKIAPLLWLYAGSEGRRIEEIAAGWDVAETYGVLADLNQSEAFVNAIAAKGGIRIAFIVTDEDRLFESVVRELPDNVAPVRIYEAYLQNFEIETMRSAL
jgi:adenine-specific DNA-methyltransferase